MTDRKIEVLSFFTGGGLLDMGFEQAGFEIIWTNEVNKEFCEVYENGITSWKWAKNPYAKPAKISEKRSIVSLKASEILKDAFSRNRPKVFGVIGGPPCIDFSAAGRNNGSAGKYGKLSKYYLNLICKIKPTFFVLENVPGLFRSKAHKKYFNTIVKKLEKNGFSVFHQILNALEMGVPQDRERLFIIGFNKSWLRRNRKDKEFNFFWPRKKYKNPKTIFSWPGRVNGSGPGEKPRNVPVELTVNYLFNHGNSPKGLWNGTEGFTPFSKKFKTTKEGDTHRKSFKRLHRHRYSPTACYGNNEVHLHPWENRRLTVREVLRIQGVPDEYILPPTVSLSSKYKCVANGVPVPLAREVGKALRKQIFKVGSK